MKTSVLAGGILLFGAAAVIYFSNGAPTGASTSEQSVAVEARQVAVCNHALEAGHFLSKHDLKWVSVDALPAGALTVEATESLTALEGAVLTKPMAEGETLDVNTLIAKDAPEFMAAVLNPGMRAFTIEVDNVTGGAGLLRPGNRVDVILAAELKTEVTGPAQIVPATRTAKTLLTNLRVVAVNKTLEPSGFRAEPAQAEKRGMRTDGKGTVTLEVTPQQVEILTVARTVGELSLSLRDLHDVKTEAPAGMTTTEDILPKRPVETGDFGKARVKSYYGSAGNHS